MEKQVEKNIYKRGPYSFQVKMQVSGHSIIETFDTLDEARAFRDMKRVSKALDPDFKRVLEARVKKKESAQFTLSAALERYLAEVTPRKKGANRERDRIRRWQARPLSKRPIADIRGKDIAEFRDAERKRGLAENSVRLEIALLSSVFEIARKEWGVETLSNPCKAIKLPAGSNQRDRRLEPNEEEYLLKGMQEVCRNFYAISIVQFALETAMRQSEILGLEWARVDTKKKVAVLLDTKNGDKRSVPLSSKALEILQGLPRSIGGGRVFRMTQDALIRASGFDRFRLTAPYSKSVATFASTSSMIGVGKVSTLRALRADRSNTRG
ncbi:MAG: site-specific integrase [Sulfuricellaceae bacterium]|nr:site-specific integrase [Sulfuricellaceae bacterium]